MRRGEITIGKSLREGEKKESGATGSAFSINLY